MPKLRKWEDPEKKKQTILLNKAVLNKLKAYAVETDQSFDDVIKGPKERFDNELLELSREIDRLRLQAVSTMKPVETTLESPIAPILE